MQIAQVLGIRPPIVSSVPTPSSYGMPLVTPPTTPISHSMFMQQQQQQQQTLNFVQPQLQTPQRLIQQPGVINQVPQTINRNTTPGQMLDLYCKKNSFIFIQTFFLIFQTLHYVNQLFHQLMNLQ